MKLPIPDSLPDWERELEELVIAQLRGDISKEQHERLSDMLRSHSLVRKTYLRRMQLEAMLDWEYAEPSGTINIADERQARFERGPEKAWIKWAAPAAIAAMLAIGLYLGFYNTEKPSTGRPDIAIILHTDTNMWPRGEDTPIAGQSLAPNQPVVLRGGNAIVSFHNGTRTNIEGSAKLIPTGKNEAQLLRGSLSLRNPRDTDSFSLKLPNNTILKIGSGSTVAVTDAETEQSRIYLLSGQATLRLNDGHIRILPIQKAIDTAGLTHDSYIYQPELAPPAPSLTNGGNHSQRTWIDQLDLRLAEQGWGQTRALSSVDGGPICIAGKKFSRGFGTHTQSHLKLALPVGGVRFISHVGKDDEIQGGSVRFIVLNEGEEIWRSKVMRHGDAPERVDLDISGMRSITLVSDHSGDGKGSDHADWANACIIHRGVSPQAIPYQPNLDSYVLTPAAAPEPRINGARVVAIQPLTPFHFKIPTTGERPINFTAENLPAGLQLDSNTGIITGHLNTKGSYPVTINAANKRGQTSRTLRIEAGDKLALTPPMGWNSWQCWGPDINEKRIRATAEAMVKYGLVDYGWSYINMDDGWQGTRGGPFNALQPNNKFPNMKKLCADIHGMGLKAGIFSTMNISSPSGFTGSSSVAANGNTANMAVPMEHRSTTSQVFGINPDVSLTTRIGAYVFLDQDALQWSEWGFDYVKINGGDNILDSMQSVRSSLNATSRSMIYMANNYIGRTHPHLMTGHAQIWSSQSDGNDSWDHVSYVIRHASKWQPHARPGSWPQHGLLQLGSIPEPSPATRTSARCQLTPEEQYTHFTSLCMLSAPLMLSCDLENLDPFTLSLLKNAEVIEVNQDALGRAAKPTPDNPSTWTKQMADGSTVIALFNLDEQKKTITANLNALGFSSAQRVRDLWRQEDLADAQGTLRADVEPHGVVLYRLWNR